MLHLVFLLYSTARAAPRGARTWPWHPSLASRMPRACGGSEGRKGSTIRVELQSDVHPVMSKDHVNPWLSNVKRLHVASGPKNAGPQCFSHENVEAADWSTEGACKGDEACLRSRGRRQYGTEFAGPYKAEHAPKRGCPRRHSWLQKKDSTSVVCSSTAAWCWAPQAPFRVQGLQRGLLYRKSSCRPARRVVDGTRDVVAAGAAAIEACSTGKQFLSARATRGRWNVRCGCSRSRRAKPERSLQRVLFCSQDQHSCQSEVCRGFSFSARTRPKTASIRRSPNARNNGPAQVLCTFQKGARANGRGGA